MVCETKVEAFPPFWVDVGKALMDRGRYLEALNMLQAAYEALPSSEASREPDK